MPSEQSADPRQLAFDLLSVVGEMQHALELIAKGRAYYGSEEREIDAETMRVIALKALGKR